MTTPDLISTERLALRRFVEFLNDTIGDRVVAVSLFGSKARGDDQPDSDVDVLVLLNEDDRNIRRRIQVKAAQISLEFDLILSPRVIGMPRWEDMRGFTLYRNVERDAVGLDVKDDELVLAPAEPA